MGRGAIVLSLLSIVLALRPCRGWASISTCHRRGGSGSWQPHEVQKRQQQQLFGDASSSCSSLRRGSLNVIGGAGRGSSTTSSTIRSSSSSGSNGAGVSAKEGGQKVVIRAATNKDFGRVAVLCLRAFRRPFEWWQGIGKWQEELDLTGKLRYRASLARKRTIKHAMMVAADGDSNALLGFMEVGMLPPPPVKKKPVDPGAMAKAAAAAMAAGGNGESVAPAEKQKLKYNAFLGLVPRSRTGEVPYLANLVVSEEARGRGIGKALVAKAEQLVADDDYFPGEKIYVTVEPNNAIAKSLYEKLGYVFVLQEDREFANMRKREFQRLYYEKSVRPQKG